MLRLTNETDVDERITEPNRVAWMVISIIIMVTAIFGNLLTVLAIVLYKKLSKTISNYLVFNLALSDLLVGISIPYHFIFSTGFMLSSNKATCILRFALVILASSSSIYNLLAIATDRYFYIVHPLYYNKYMTRKVMSGIIIFGWIFTLFCASVIVFWNNWSSEKVCTLDQIVPTQYLTFGLTPIFLTVWVGIFLVYLKIWRIASMQAKRIKEETYSFPNYNNDSDSKSVQVVMLILGCFSICWLPYIVVIILLTVVGDISNVLYEVTFTMAMANSCMNPLIYAWKNTNFREAFWCIMRCQPPRHYNQRENFITNHIPNDNVKRATLNSNGKSETTSNHTEIEMCESRSQLDYKDWDQESMGNVATISTGQ